MKLKGKMTLTGIIPVLLMGTAVLLIVGTEIKTSIRNKENEMLRTVAYTALQNFETRSDEPYTMKDGYVYKGDFNISDTEKILDNEKKETNVDLSFFYGDTRIVTTIIGKDGSRAIGTKAGDKVVKTVLHEDKPYSSYKINIMGTNYYGYYMPVHQPSGETVGMMFAGIPSTGVEKEIGKVQRVLLLSIIASLGVCIFLSIYIATRMGKALKKSTSALSDMSAGNLNITMDETVLNRKDEIGDIAKSTEMLRSKLEQSIRGIMEICLNLTDEANHLDSTASQTMATTEQVEKAIYEIAQGATSQAAETQKASEEVVLMGKMVKETTDEVERLNQKAVEMNDLSSEAETILNKLKEITERAKEAVSIIHKQTNTTNESALKIKEATEIITSIAEETNLLSLNASIEAARAGEQGKGFAVVASQIQKLAEQSDDSARVIAGIVNSLIDDSNEAVGTMNEVNEIITTQVNQVVATGNIFGSVKEGIHASITGVNNIARRTEKLDGARVSVVDAVQNLTAIAQENAAGTEETSAATEEVSASITAVAGQSQRLNDLAKQLEDNVRIFKLDM